jgi:hypothetical protein
LGPLRATGTGLVALHWSISGFCQMYAQQSFMPINGNQTKGHAEKA